MRYSNYSDDSLSHIDDRKSITVDSSQVNLTQEANSQYIKYGDSYAYVYKDYVTKENIPVMFWGTVTDSALNIRQKPSSSSAKLGVFSDYPRVRIYGMTGNWYKIRYEDQDAWIYSSYVKKD